MTTEVEDLNKRAQNGQPIGDPRQNAKPMNDKARQQKQQEMRVLTVREILSDSVKRTTAKERPHAIMTGFADLDDATGGLRDGFVWVFGAATNWGKSTWLVAVADEALQQQKIPLIVSAEDSESIYGDRLLARRARVNAKRLRDGRLTNPELERIMAVTARAEQSPVYLDVRGKPVEVVAKQIDTLIREKNVGLVLLDYLQAMGAKRQYQDERVKYREIARRSTDVVKDNNKAGIIFSQITVDPKKKIPDRDSVRECKDICMAAEVAAFGFTPAEDMKRKSDGSVIARAGGRYCYVDKVKDGPGRFILELPWDDESACFLRKERQPGPYDEFDDIADDFRGGP